MRTIAFYISSHGFGHASRNIPIIEALCSEAGIRIIVKTGKNQLDFMKQSLGSYSSKISFYEKETDIGLVLKEGTTEVDRAALKNKLTNFIQGFSSLCEEEKLFLIEEKVHLVVSDIVPWIFGAAKDINIKSVLISNFTWVEIYEELGLAEGSKVYKELYARADNVLVYPLSTGFEKNYPRYIDIGLSCRSFNDEKISKIRESSSLPKVFVSVGRSVNLKDAIDVENLPYTFIYTEGISLLGNNPMRLPESTLNTHDYLAACDYIITKAGWGTVAEALCARKPMLVLERNEIFEDRNTLNKLVALNLAVPFRACQFSSAGMSGMLETLKLQKVEFSNLESNFKDNSKLIAGRIIDLVKEVNL